MAWLLRALDRLGVGIVLVVLGLILALRTEYFLTWKNLSNILTQTSVTTIMAVGMTFVITTAEIDLSVGSLLALCGMVTGLLLEGGYPVPIAVTAGLAVGAMSGLIAGGIVVTWGLPSFIVTLGLLYINRGIALLLTDAKPLYGFPESFTMIAKSSVGPLPLPALEALTAVALGQIVLSKTMFGRQVVAVGGNPLAARLSGVSVRSIKMGVFLLSGLCTGIASAITVARQDSATPIIGEGQELDVIAAVIIGGTSLFGGRGTVIGTLFGALLMGVLRNGLTLLDIASVWQKIVIGCVIVIAVLLDYYRRKLT
jgi:putative xylitol transport system permease protein